MCAGKPYSVKTKCPRKDRIPVISCVDIFGPNEEKLINKLNDVKDVMQKVCVRVGFTGRMRVHSQKECVNY